MRQKTDVSCFVAALTAVTVYKSTDCFPFRSSGFAMTNYLFSEKWTQFSLIQNKKQWNSLYFKNGTTRKGKVTVILERNGSIIAIKEIPAQVCDNCGEYFLISEMTKEILERAEQAFKKGVEVEVIKMTKVA